MGSVSCPRRGGVPRRPSLRSDRGASVVEFVMMAVLLVGLLFAVLQVAVFAYCRNIVSASAADGARFAAGAGTPVSTGADRASALIRSGLGSSAARRITCQADAAVDTASGLPVSRVRCRGQLPMLFLPLRMPVSIDVTASSLKEGQP